MNNCISLVNGKFKNSISVQDRGLSYGDGLFETMSWRYLKNEEILGVEFWERHINRLKKSCYITKINFPSINLLKKYKKKILEKCLSKGMFEGVLKIIITRGVGGRGYKFEKNISPTIIFLTFPERKIEKNFLNDGVNLRFCKSPISVNSQLGGLKHLNRMDSVMARSEWDADNFFDGVMLDDSENIIDGTMTNLFFSRDKVLYTPLIKESGINGIMRQVIIDKSKLFFHKVLEIEIKKNSVSNFDEMFVTNSLIKILPVKSLGSKKFKVSDSTKKLIDLLTKRDGNLEHLELV